MNTWILNDRGIAVPEPSLTRWGKWMIDPKNKQIARTEIHHCTVSTVFLGIDYNFTGDGDPVLFETMVFQGEGESTNYSQTVSFDGSEEEFWGDMRRYSYRVDALEGHKQAVAAIEKQFGQVQDRVSGLLYGIINAEEWVKDK